jgi:hypothetical protein
MICHLLLSTSPTLALGLNQSGFADLNRILFTPQSLDMRLLRAIATFAVAF